MKFRIQFSFTLGLIYCFGDAEIVNEMEPLQWFEKATEDNPYCYRYFGDIYNTEHVFFLNKDEFCRLLDYNIFTCHLEMIQILKKYERLLACYLKAVATKIARIYFYRGLGG